MIEKVMCLPEPTWFRKSQDSDILNNSVLTLWKGIWFSTQAVYSNFQRERFSHNFVLNVIIIKTGMGCGQIMQNIKSSQQSGCLRREDGERVNGSVCGLFDITSVKVIFAGDLCDSLYHLPYCPPLTEFVLPLRNKTLTYGYNNLSCQGF